MLSRSVRRCRLRRAVLPTLVYKPPAGDGWLHEIKATAIA
jgi:hypothetical protein